jgi:hypothetical protein
MISQNSAEGEAGLEAGPRTTMRQGGMFMVVMQTSAPPVPSVAGISMASAGHGWPVARSIADDL